ncbi:MAG: DUF3108 domain-containing protein [Salaquimonas sp.]
MLNSTFKKAAIFAGKGAAILFLGASITLSTPQITTADTKGHQTVFNVKFGGISVGKMTFGLSVDGKDYKFIGNGKTEGLADWFASGKANIQSTGKLDGDQLIAGNHYLSVTEKKKVAVLKMAFKNGEVESVFLKPDKRKVKTEPKYAVITPDQLKNVVDPASTLIVPVDIAKAKDPNSVCGRTFKVYDGDTRFDMAMSYKRNAKISTKGYDGFTYVCKLKYVPVAGHKRNHKNTKRMAENNDMEIWLAPVDGGNETQSIFTAIRIVVPTWLGTFSAEPIYFGPAKS